MLPPLNDTEANTTDANATDAYATDAITNANPTPDAKAYMLKLRTLTPPTLALLYRC